MTEPKWLTERRAKAEASLSEFDVPTTRDTGWEFTDLAGFDPSNFQPAQANGSAKKRAEGLVEAIEGAEQLEQIDSTPLSTNGAVAEGKKPGVPTSMPLIQAAELYPELVADYLGKIVPPQDFFSSNNQANWQGGAFVYVPAGKSFEAPVQITATQAADHSELTWRTLIVLEEGAQAEVWEQYLSDNEKTEGLFNTVVELVVGPGANLRYVCGQGLSEKSWIFGSQRAEVEQDGNLDWVALGFGSGRGKVRMETKLAGRGANARVTGAYASYHSQHIDFDTTQEHAAANTTSDLAFRGVLDDKSTAVWRGMIRVDPGAQRTDAFQESRNLLLSKRAHADAIPGLEIEADDVRCTHAAAIAQIDQSQVFYLKSRGLSDEVATRLVIDGFMQSIVERLANGRLHDAVSAAVEKRLNKVLG